MLSDAIPGQPYQLGTQVDVSITFNDVEESKEVFNKLKEGGEVIIPIAETAWSPSYGQLIDKYGIKWQFSTILE